MVSTQRYQHIIRPQAESGELPRQATAEINKLEILLSKGGGEPVKKLCTTTAPSAISDANVGDMSWPKVIIRLSSRTVALSLLPLEASRGMLSYP